MKDMRDTLMEVMGDAAGIMTITSIRGMLTTSMSKTRRKKEGMVVNTSLSEEVAKERYGAEKRQYPNWGRIGNDDFVNDNWEIPTIQGSLKRLGYPSDSAGAKGEDGEERGKNCWRE